VSIIEVVCAWEPLVQEREIEKRLKYEPLATDTGRTKYKDYIQPTNITLCGRDAGNRNYKYPKATGRTCPAKAFGQIPR